ncbi:LytTR family transcriptional regulator DNA-binding domain-containing protein [Ornithinibacillus californiensis]|uniref:LytTR family transcriptional regulator DNA-binding domain-containing protein n=1 Tax=Ornithinibacillus californiensis TaxID=161536 RepID=UPI00064E121B|nr:LytTR family transcriptional regulator DNA-binding domain-containing protein [Ornithinibacillus californiensis]
MSVLTIHNLEKQDKDVLLFPAFDLEVVEGEVAVIHSNLNIRVALLRMIMGQEPLLNGELTVLGEKVSKDKKLYELGIGISFYEEGYYPRLSVLDQLKFYQQLYDSNQTVKQILNLVQLDSIKNKKIGLLTFSEKRRLHIANVLLQEPTLVIFEEPDLNVDLETKRVILNIFQKLKEEQKAVLVLTSNMENAITMGDNVYRLNDTGIHRVEVQDESPVTKEVVQVETEEKEETIAFNFNKIPTKVNEKIILFDPPEIDYIESNEGISHVYIKGESFPSVFTLNELEERLNPYGFFRCHRSYIVNLQKVREVITWTRNSYSLVLDDTNKSTIPLSKTKMAQLKEMLGLK